MRSHRYTPGADGAGVVAAVGDGVTSFKEGQRVFVAGTLTGTYAQYALANVASVHALSDNVSTAQGAAVNVAYRTAYRALFVVSE